MRKTHGAQKRSGHTPNDLFARIGQKDEKNPIPRQVRLVESTRRPTGTSPLPNQQCVARFAQIHHVEATMKSSLSLILALAALFVFAFSAVADDAQAKNKAKKAATVRGVIADLKAESGKDAGTMNLTIQKKGKKGEPAPEPEKKTITVPEGVKIELVSGKKGALTTTAGSFKDLKAGETVSVTLCGDNAKAIKIRGRAQK
jgi:hypothetical protein